MTAWAHDPDRVHERWRPLPALAPRSKASTHPGLNVPEGNDSESRPLRKGAEAEKMQRAV